MTGSRWHGQWPRRFTRTTAAAACSRRTTTSWRGWRKAATRFRCITCARANGRAIWGCCTKWPRGPGGLAAGLGDLPLFSAAIQAEQEECDSLRDTLSALDVDALSPREALDMLYQLKREAGES